MTVQQSTMWTHTAFWKKGRLSQHLAFIFRVWENLESHVSVWVWSHLLPNGTLQHDSEQWSRTLAVGALPKKFGNIVFF